MGGRRTRLAQRRKALGFTQEELAARLGVDPTTVRRWESGETEGGPQPWLRPKLAHYLQVSAEQLDELLAQATPGSEAEVVADISDGPMAQGGVLLAVIVNGHPVLLPLDAATVAASGLDACLDDHDRAGYSPGVFATPAEWEAMSPLNRRVLLQYGVAAAALPALGPTELRHVTAALGDARRYLDGSVVDYFRHQLDRCRADDASSGPTSSLPLVLGILNVIQRHARDVKPDVRRALLTVGAEGATFAGWLYRDMHDLGMAVYWLDRAIEWAQEAGDMPMQGYVLLQKSGMAYQERDALRVFTLAQAAQYGPWQLPSKVRAEVTHLEARGLAMLGEPLSAVEQKLDDAQRSLDAVNTDDERYAHLNTYYDESTHLLLTASCYIEAGKPAWAATLFGEFLTSGSLSRRAEGYFRARHAAALALSGEPDDAAHEGLTAMRLATEIQSRRTTRELARVVEALTPWGNRPGPRALREALSA